LLPPEIKSRGRLHFKLAKLQAEMRQPGAWALLRDGQGRLTEGTGSNFFAVVDSVLRTCAEAEVVPGVTRSVVLELTDRLAVPTVQRAVHTSELDDVTEAFFTSTVVGLVHVRSIDRKFLNGGASGPITRQLQEAFAAETTRDYAKSEPDSA
jgi:branched-subunit amino acid aminotransferase/4-amino-4-deoxychorismate lyase